MDRTDDAVERTLAAMGRAKAPEGLEGRVVARMERRALDAEAARSAMAGSWWCGAACGAAAATLMVGCAMWLGHFGVRKAVEMNPHASAPVSVPVGLPANGRSQAPCASPAVVRTPRSAASPRVELVAVEKPKRAPSFLAEAPLTAEERGLVMLAQSGAAKQLDTLNPETRAKVEAEDAAEFDRFFTPPAAPSTKEGNE